MASLSFFKAYVLLQMLRYDPKARCLDSSNAKGTLVASAASISGRHLNI